MHLTSLALRSKSLLKELNEANAKLAESQTSED